MILQPEPLQQEAIPLSAEYRAVDSQHDGSYSLEWWEPLAGPSATHIVEATEEESLIHQHVGLYDVSEFHASPLHMVPTIEQLGSPIEQHMLDRLHSSNSQDSCSMVVEDRRATLGDCLVAVSAITGPMTFSGQQGEETREQQPPSGCDDSSEAPAADSAPRMRPRGRMKWTGEMHSLFVEAILRYSSNEMDMKTATPRRILNYMRTAAENGRLSDPSKVKTLTRLHVASHLQVSEGRGSAPEGLHGWIEYWVEYLLVSLCPSPGGFACIIGSVKVRSRGSFAYVLSA
eukprot:GHVU01111498.1.p1 GENE.GHVU01111498.1~~GHVU01111498.1.p1  ORF type:complete len:288 (-),score=17.21 GHVU01111498.1:761-1624(-)